MKAHYLLLLILCISWHSNAQVNAVVEDSILDRYYINYPIDTGAEYHIGDTVAAVYGVPMTFSEKTYFLFFGRTLVSRAKTVHVVRAVITDVYQDSTRTYQYISGLKLKVFRIERHYKGNVTYPEEYVKNSDCPIIKNTEKWYDVHDWRNITGLYRIKNFTDNYRLGDTVSRFYFTDPSLVGSIFGNGRTKVYSISAVVKEMDTTNRQTLLLEITDISVPYTDGVLSTEPGRGSMLYNYENIHRGDHVWTKPYYWLKAGQTIQVNDGTAIPGGRGFDFGCGFRLLLYDCEGNRYTF